MFKDGKLIIRTNYRRDGKFGTGWYTGAVTTAKKPFNGGHTPENFKGFSAAYGYFEVRCIVPKIYGAWAAFWLMPDNNFENDIPGTGEDGVEADIFESPFLHRSLTGNSVTHALHIDGYGDELKSKGSQLMHMEKSIYDEYHTYGMEWNEKEYIFYIDGVETWRTADKCGTVAGVSEYIILSVEVGGIEKDGELLVGKILGKNGAVVKEKWAGSAEKNDKSKNYDFIVDYVKVYQKD